MPQGWRRVTKVAAYNSEFMVISLMYFLCQRKYPEHAKNIKNTLFIGVGLSGLQPITTIQV